MKKFFLSAFAFAVVAVSAITVTPNTAEAFPAFARQTGAACLSCHFQTFPALNAFGRAFMMGSFTDVGEQALVEDDNLSIPAVLNASFEVRGAFTNTNTTGSASESTYEIPKNARLFLAGRIGTNSGAVVVFNGGSDSMNMKPAMVWMLLNSWDVGDFKVGIGAHKSPWGGSNVMEVSNVFGHRGDKLAGQDITAITKSGFTQQTTAIGTWVGNDMGILQFALLSPATETQNTTNLGLSFGKLVRGIATLDVGGWDTLIGFGIVTGTAGRGTAAGSVATRGNKRIPMNLQFVDAQMQGDVGDMSVGIYADWAHANGKTSSAGTNNFYGAESGGIADGQDYDAFSIRTDVEPIERLILGVGYSYAKTTQVAGSTDAESVEKTFHLAATYKLYQNFDINLVYNDVQTDAGTIAAPTSSTTRTTTLEVDVLM